MNRAYAGVVGIVLTMLTFKSMPDEKAHYYAAEDLVDDCVSRNLASQNQCYGVIYGVIGSLGFLQVAHSPFANVLCMPPMSAASVKDKFLSAFYADRHAFNGMLAGSAVASVLYDRYPCATEKSRREQEGKKAAEELDRQFPPK